MFPVSTIWSMFIYIHPYSKMISNAMNVAIISLFYNCLSPNRFYHNFMISLWVETFIDLCVTNNGFHSILTWRQWIVHKNGRCELNCGGLRFISIDWFVCILYRWAASPHFCAWSKELQKLEVSTSYVSGIVSLVDLRDDIVSIPGAINGRNNYAYHKGFDNFPALTFTKYDQTFSIYLPKIKYQRESKSLTIFVCGTMASSLRHPRKVLLGNAKSNVCSIDEDWYVVRQLMLPKHIFVLTIGFGASSCWLYYFLVYSLRFRIFLVICGRASNAITFRW